VNGGGESPFTKGARLSVAYGVGNDPGAPITTGPSIPADPLTLVTPSPMAGKMPVPHFICPPTTASSKLNDIFTPYA
jgi:hypothetical protein